MSLPQEPDHLDHLSGLRHPVLRSPLPLGTPCRLEIRSPDLGACAHLLAGPYEACVIVIAQWRRRGREMGGDGRDGRKWAG